MTTCPIYGIWEMYDNEINAQKSTWFDTTWYYYLGNRKSMQAYVCFLGLHLQTWVEFNLGLDK